MSTAPTVSLLSPPSGDLEWSTGDSLSECAPRLSSVDFSLTPTVSAIVYATSDGWGIDQAAVNCLRRAAYLLIRTQIITTTTYLRAASERRAPSPVDLRASAVSLSSPA